MKSLFSNSTIIKTWAWDGDMECQTILPDISDESGCAKVELDSESLLSRNLKLRKNKLAVSQSKPPKKLVQPSVQESHTTFLPAPIHKMTQTELKQTLKSIGLQTTGTRTELVQRLEHFMNKKS